MESERKRESTHTHTHGHTTLVVEPNFLSISICIFLLFCVDKNNKQNKTKTKRTKKHFFWFRLNAKHCRLAYYLANCSKIEYNQCDLCRTRKTDTLIIFFSSSVCSFLSRIWLRSFFCLFVVKSNLNTLENISLLSDTTGSSWF